MRLQLIRAQAMRRHRARRRQAIWIAQRAWLLLILICGLRAQVLSVHARKLTAQASTELAGYTDSTHVNVASPTVAASVTDAESGVSVSGRYLVDVVSAASVDIVATASPRWNEVRHVGSLEASVQRGPLHVSGSAGISREPDYLSVSAGASASLDLLEKNLTPFVGFRYGHDDVGVKGRPRADWELLQKGGLQLGATFVINHFMIASVQLDADFERGYLAKPYRYIPLFAPGTGADIPVGAAIDEVNAKRIPERPIERLPSARNRYAVTGRIAARRGPATLRIDERIYTDSWGVSATTTDARVMIDLGSRVMIWPHLRFHAQSGASFWQRAYELLPTEEGAWTVPRYRTGDRELSKLNTYTGGLGGKFRLTDQADSIWHITCQLEAGYTSFFDALYITSRWSVLSVIGISAEWN